MTETENRYTRIAQRVAEQIVAKAEALAETMEVPVAMERLRSMKEAQARVAKMGLSGRIAEEARVGEDKLAALIRGGEEVDNT